MSGECSFFNFCLRGRDSLVSKWISQKRKIPETLKTDGANIYAIYARDSIFNDSIKNKSDFCERGTGKYYSIIATGSKGQSIFWKLGR